MKRTGKISDGVIPSSARDLLYGQINALQTADSSSHMLLGMTHPLFNRRLGRLVLAVLAAAVVALPARAALF
ncbi:MAG TPA: hypothetical protein VF959_03355, partial [Casimicrobiaceae bacterium]